jgi:glycosyltransferase involved in cell wall biosynthesis
MVDAVSLSTPGRGGTFRFYVNLREGLAGHGIRLRWLAAGRAAAESFASGAYSEDLNSGEVILGDSANEEACARALVNYIADHRIRFVLINAMCGPVETCIARYLPRDVCRIMMVHTITPSTYRGARTVRDWVHATVGVSPAISRELASHYGFPQEWTLCIPNGINVGVFLAAQRVPPTPTLRVLTHGRVDDLSKGTFWIPEIIRRALGSGANLHLTVSGGGPDLDRLREHAAHAGLNGAVTFLGWTDPSQVPALVASHDVLLFPSRFEGHPVAMLEAMAGGCVPVASRIAGVTDFVVNQGVNGLLFPVGDTKAAASCLVRLAGDRTMLQQFSARARESMAEGFSFDRQAAAFASAIQKAMETPRPLKDPLPLDKWRVPGGLRPAWWHPLPRSAKNWLRKWQERLRAMSLVGVMALSLSLVTGYAARTSPHTPGGSRTDRTTSPVFCSYRAGHRDGWGGFVQIGFTSW